MILQVLACLNLLVVVLTSFTYLICADSFSICSQSTALTKINVMRRSESCPISISLIKNI